jgi:hypothetical protein
MRSSLLRLPVLVSALLIAAGPHGFAEVSAEGTPEIAHIEVNNASLAEVLKALHDAYGLTWRSDVPLDARISGTFEGPLPRVIARLLDGKNYVLTKSDSNFRVVIVAAAGSAPIAPAAAMPVPAPLPAPSAKAIAPPQLPPGFFPPAPPPARSAGDR